MWLCALSPLTGLIAIALPWVAACHLQPQRIFRPGFSWCILVLIFGCRVGEASNPGPPLDEHFVMGVFNPSGLRGKAPFLVSHLAHGDLWAVSETHLCQQGIKDFQAGLRFAQSSYKCVAGFPVPAQRSRTHQGQWKGVAMISRFPTRALPMHGPAGIFESSRALISATLVHMMSGLREDWYTVNQTATCTHKESKTPSFFCTQLRARFVAFPVAHVLLRGIGIVRPTVYQLLTFCIAMDFVTSKTLHGPVGVLLLFQLASTRPGKISASCLPNSRPFC